MVYKNCVAKQSGRNVDEISGIEALLLRLEYSADTMLGRRASDIGASFKVVKYYDAIENSNGNQELIRSTYDTLDDFERKNVRKINLIIR